jgi:hypothetical protein
LFILHRACSHEFMQNLKALAYSQGAEDVDFEEDWYDAPVTTKDERVMRMHDLPSFAASGLSLGYESASQQNQ